jgi:hypothetical protein
MVFNPEIIVLKIVKLFNGFNYDLYFRVFFENGINILRAFVVAVNNKIEIIFFFNNNREKIIHPINIRIRVKF